MNKPVNLASLLIERQTSCKRCHATREWRVAIKPLVRQNPTIHRLQCNGCGAEIIAKVVEARGDTDARRRALVCEHAAPNELQSAYPQDLRLKEVVQPISWRVTRTRAGVPGFIRPARPPVTSDGRGFISRCAIWVDAINSGGLHAPTLGAESIRSPSGLSIKSPRHCRLDPTRVRHSRNACKSRRGQHRIWRAETITEWTE